MRETDRYVKRTLETGLAPIEMKYQPVFDCANGEPVAYLGEAHLNSVLYGTLAPADYEESADMAEEGVELAFASFRKVMRLVDALCAKAVRFSFVSFRAPAALLLSDGLYEKLTAEMKAAGFTEPGRVALSFAPEILTMELPAAKSGFSAIGAAGLRTLVRDCGKEDFPLMRLLSFTPDFVSVSPSLTALLSDRDRSGAVSPFFQMLKGLHIAAIANGVPDDDTVRAFSRCEAFGFLPSADYRGHFSCHAALLTEDALIPGKEN